MSDLQLTLTSEEHDYLVTLLQRVLKEVKVEEHRTRSPTYREHIIHDEEHINSLLKKLGEVCVG